MTRRGGRYRGPPRGNGHHPPQQQYHHQHHAPVGPPVEPPPLERPAQAPAVAHIGYVVVRPTSQMSKREQREKARESKRREKYAELARLDGEIWEAKASGNEFEWCSLMGQRMLVEENYTDTDDEEEDAERANGRHGGVKQGDAKANRVHSCNCEHCPVKKAYAGAKAAAAGAKKPSRQEKQAARQAEIARINRDMVHAKMRGDDFEYYSQMGLRMLMDEQDSESEDEEEQDYDGGRTVSLLSSGHPRPPTPPVGFSGYAGGVVESTTAATRPNATSAVSGPRSVLRTGFAVMQTAQPAHQAQAVRAFAVAPERGNSQPQQSNGGRGGGTNSHGNGGRGRGRGRGQRRNRSRSRSRDRSGSRRARYN